MEKIQGIDGYTYVVKDGRLVKIVAVEYEDDFFASTGKWAKYTLEDKTIIQICKICYPSLIGNGYCAEHSTSGTPYLINGGKNEG